jgi:hypothetical protein
MRNDAMPIVSVPFIGMDLGAIWSIAPTFFDFLEKLFNS